MLTIKQADSGESLVVIDRMHNKPLRDFPNLPLTISTKAEGWLMEAWEREDERIEQYDLLQRMALVEIDEESRTIPKGVYNKLNRRKELARKRLRCLAWNDLKDTESFWDINLFEDLSLNPQWVKDNTTRHLVDLDRVSMIELERQTRERKKSNENSSESFGRNENSTNVDGHFSHVRSLPPAMSMIPENSKKRQQGVIEMETQHPIKWSKNRPTAPSTMMNESRQQSITAPVSKIVTAYDGRSLYAAALPENITSINGLTATRQGDEGLQLISAGELQETGGIPASKNVDRRAPISPAAAATLSYVDTSDDQAYLYAEPYSRSENGLDPNDCRFHRTTSGEDRRQLLYSLHQPIKQVLDMVPEATTFVNLEGSYKLAWNDLQSFWCSHVASSRSDHTLSKFPMLKRLPAWTGNIGDFDLIAVPLAFPDLHNNQEYRERLKQYRFQFTISGACVKKARDVGMLDSDGYWLNMPTGVWVKLENAKIIIIGFRYA